MELRYKGQRKVEWSFRWTSTTSSLHSCALPLAVALPELLKSNGVPCWLTHVVPWLLLRNLNALSGRPGKEWGEKERLDGVTRGRGVRERGSVIRSAFRLEAGGYLCFPFPPSDPWRPSSICLLV